MMGSLAAAGLSQDDLPEWFLDPPRGSSQVVVPREVRLVLPVRKTLLGPEEVRHVMERPGLLQALQPYTHGGTFLTEAEAELIRYERRGDREVRYKNIDGAWRRI